MKKNILIIMVSAFVLCGCASVQKTTMLDIRPRQVYSVMAKVADWQLAYPSQHPTTEWHHGALFAGFTAWAQMADDDKYFQALLGFGEKNKWQPHERVFHADDHAVAQMYIELYKKYRNPEMIAPIRERFDYILANQPDTPLTHDNKEHKKRYNWCDALFMAPPVWAKLASITGEKKYLDYMNKEWWATTAYLYDTEEQLYFRDDRYFKKREINGKKVFWSRGNGWVFGGLVRVLEEMPADYPDRSKYERIYKQMAAKIMEIQPAEGLWHSSLLDPVEFSSKEASGSGFYCYGLAWGINHGLLDAEKYLPAVKKAWLGLVDCVHPNGMLGNVQPVGADPRRVNSDQTEVYGVGAFLLAGSEVYKLAVRNGARVQRLTVSNQLMSFRDSQTVSMNFQDLQCKVEELTEDNVAVFDFKSNSLLRTQIVDGGTELLFQIDMAPGEKKYFWVIEQPAKSKQPKSKDVAFCRFVPERKDDFAWENDKLAFRMYGPALLDNAVNSGVDCWLKRVSYPIINKWYGQMKKKGYHKDWGEGHDPYHVGKTAGCGGLRIYQDGKYLHSNVYDSWKVIENGPIRSVFELSYDKSWKSSDKKLIETKRVTIDLGQRLCRFDCAFTGDDAGAIEKFAVGLTTHDGKAKSYSGDDKSMAVCWEKINGLGLGTAVFVTSPDVQRTKVVAEEGEDEGHFYLMADKKGEPNISYYLGYAWEKAGEITTLKMWQDYLENFKNDLNNPPLVQIAE